jgi:hypothetical protein
MNAAMHSACALARRLLGVNFFTPFRIGQCWYYVAPAIPSERQPETVFGPFKEQDKADWDATSCESMW